jgi:hypothetical protein
MSSSEPFFRPPGPEHHPEDVRDDHDLGDDPEDQPDILNGEDESEPDLESVVHHRDLPLRRPDVGEKLTDQDLEDELGG